MRAATVPIPTHAFDDVYAYIAEHYAQPSKWWLGHVPAALDELKVAGVEVGKLAKVWDKMTEPWRYKLATWEWLARSRGLKDLPAIQQMCRLEHVYPTAFAAKIVANAAHVASAHLPLQLWVARRVALLELVTQPVSPVAPEELKRSAMLLRDATLKTYRIDAVDPEEAVAASRQILKAAMDGAADAAKTAFDAEDCRLSANFMIPLPPNHPQFDASELARRNGEHAAELWGPEYSRCKRLVIVAETRGSEHLGFWVPLQHGAGGATLPGAAAAFAHRDGGVVFKDDLPWLQGFPPAVENRWRAYMENDFKEKLFFSVPFRVPRATSRLREAAAVLNVNVDPGDLRVWRRAYHPEWLRIARDRAEPFLEVAHAAVRLIASHVPALFLDSGSEQWDRLPDVGPRKRIGGPQ